MSDNLDNIFADAPLSQASKELFDWEALALFDPQLDQQQETFQEIKKAYARWLIDQENSPNLRFFDNDKSHGVAVLSLGSSSETLIYAILYHLIAKLKSYKYIVNLAEKSIQEDTVSFHVYLKPSMYLREHLKAVQLFGNISIKGSVNKSTGSALRLMAHTYQDSKYNPPFSMDEWIEMLCEEGFN